MPVKSKRQLRFMAAVAQGSIKKRGLSKSKAREFVDSTGKGAKLPEKARKKR